MYLLELKPFANVPKFGPTDTFKKVYGHYCGPGNEGGEPIDDIDNACKCHDECYHYTNRHNPECDKEFISKLDGLLKTHLSFKQRAVATAMKLYFKKNAGKAQA